MFGIVLKKRRPEPAARKKFFFEYFQLKKIFSQKNFFSNIGRFIHQNVQNEILRNF